MTGEERLAELFQELRALDIPCLVMGGHAVRFYGVDRSTLDYDRVVALDASEWDALPDRLRRAPALANCREGHSCRPADFRRFVVGTLPDGREERLEFWRRNHLLAPWIELDARRVDGQYGGRTVAFVGIDDLIRSKETEREDDWRDVRLLEEIADERRVSDGSDASVRDALSRLRSQRGFDRAVQAGFLAVRERVAEAYAASRHELALAFLRPYAPLAIRQHRVGDPIARILDGPLRAIEPASARHRALVEAVRRLYMAQRMTEDRADKQSLSAG